MKNSIIKILTLIIGFAVVMACDPMKDVYDELDKNPSSISADLDFTLEEDDYELSGIESAAKFKSFSSIDDAKEGIPNILAERQESARLEKVGKMPGKDGGVWVQNNSR